ncbi:MULTISPECIES: hypothetical protein [unclassified Bradyrhizobium]|uniref:hypothetical protein n=1 Tax=unclassified Bradyrhizobium TaxID=2631580 RepID=UPI002916387A|nr:MULTISPECIES: hypothetical protein [unclassified Bradyrhizobium]
MSVVTVMAAILEDELVAYGVLGLSQVDCKAIVQRLIDRTVELEVVGRSWIRSDPYLGEQN